MRKLKVGEVIKEGDFLLFKDIRIMANKCIGRTQDDNMSRFYRDKKPDHRWFMYIFKDSSGWFVCVIPPNGKNDKLDPWGPWAKRSLAVNFCKSFSKQMGGRIRFLENGKE